MKIEQKKFSNIHSFEFKDNLFNFSYSDKSGSGDIDVAYANLPRKTSVRIDDNSWWRNAGFIWCCIGVLQIGLAIASGKSTAGTGLWLVVGLICLAVYHLSRVKYTVLSFEGGNVFIIQDGKTHDKVLSELMNRRKSQLLSLYGEIDLESTIEREKAKFEYLKEQGILSVEEVDTKIRQAKEALGTEPETLKSLH